MNTITHKNCSLTSGSLILVNAKHPYRGDTVPSDLVTVGQVSGVLLERRAAALLERLMEDIHAWGQIAAVSAWRSEEEQRALWDGSLRDKGESFTRKFVAPPGCSEHQTGLAIDLGLRQEDIDFIRPDFPYEGICQAFRQKAAQYGFIQRYPSGKEHITGIAHEPWHFRYVGIPHAKIMETMAITLEEYLELLRQYSAQGKPFEFKSGAFKFHISYLGLETQNAVLPETMDFIVSGDNEGGLIITSWENEGC